MRDGTLFSPEPALPPPLRRPVAGLALLAAIAGTVLAAFTAGQATAGHLDARVQFAVQRTLPSARPGALLVDLIGEPVGAATLVTLLAAICLILRRGRLAVLAVAGPALSAVATTLLKPVVGRTINGGFLAYPSGHTAVATALALVLALLTIGVLGFRMVTALLVLLAAVGTAGAAMAWSQVALNAHYPSDAFGGFCVALSMVPAMAFAIDRMADGRFTARAHEVR